MRPSAAVLLAVVMLIAPRLGAQLRELKIEVSNVVFDERDRVLTLDITNIYTEPITAYKVSAMPDCPGDVTGATVSVGEFFSVNPEKDDPWRSPRRADQGMIQPGAVRKVELKIGEKRTPTSPCQGANLSDIAAVFSDGTGTGNREVVLEIVNYRRGESKQYSRWLAPYQEALSSETPAVALDRIIERLDAEYAQFSFRANDHFEEGERHANRSIRDMVEQLASMYREKGKVAGQFASHFLQRHRERVEALARY